MKGTYIQEGRKVDYVNGSGVVIAYGTVIAAVSRIFVAAESIDIATTGAVYTEGVFEFPAINTAAFAVGDPVYFDVVAGKITNVALGNIPAGWVVEAKLEAGTTVKVSLQPSDIVASGFRKGERFYVTFPNIAAADVAKAFFVAPAACKIISAYETHGTVCDAADTMTIEKCNTGEDAGSGDVVLAAPFTLNSTANTPVTKAAVTDGKESLVAGDTLMLKFVVGDGTNYAEGCVTVTMEWA